MFKKLVAVAMAAALMTGASGSYAHGGETVYDLASPNASSNDLNGSPSTVVPTPADLVTTDPANDVLVGSSAALTGTQTVISIDTTLVGAGIGIGAKVGGAPFGGTSSESFNLTVTAGITSGGALSIGGDVGELQAAAITAKGNIDVGDTRADNTAAEYTVTSTGAFGLSDAADGDTVTVSGAKTTVTAGQLVMDNLTAGESQTLVVNNKATLNIVGGNAPTEFGNTSGGGNHIFQLLGSNANFVNGLAIGQEGQLVAGRTNALDNAGGTNISNLAVGARDAANTVGGLRIQYVGGLEVTGNTTLNVLETLADPAASADVEEKYGDIVLTNAGTITMGANSTVNAGVLLVDGSGTTSEIDGIGTGSVLNLEGLTVAADASFISREGVRINGGVGDIQGTHVMLDDETYDSLVIGEEGTFAFNGGDVKTLTIGSGTSSTGTITLTQGGTQGALLENQSTYDLTIAGATSINVIAGTTPGSSARIATAINGGDIIATDSILNVGAALDIDLGTATEVSVKQLKVTAGETTANGDGIFSSAEQAVIGGGNVEAKYLVSGGSVTEWHKGVRIAENGSVELTAPNLNDGTFVVGGDIVLDGGAIVGSTNGTALSFTREGTTTPKVLVTGAGSTITNQVEFTGMDLVVNIAEADASGNSEFNLGNTTDAAIVDGIANVTLTKGEIAFGNNSAINMTGDFTIADGAGFYADGTAATITTATGTGKIFTLNQGGWAAADNGVVTIDGFESASLDGAMAFGLQVGGTEAGKLVFTGGTDVTVGNNATFIFDADLTEKLGSDVDITGINNKAVVLQGELGTIAFTARTVKSGLGQFGLTHLSDAAGDKVAITSATNNLWNDKSYEQQVTQMQNNLSGALGENGLGAYATRDLAAAVHGVTVAPNLTPADTDHEIHVLPPVAPALTNIAGENNLLQLEMIGTATGLIHESQLASLLGVNVNNGILATIGTVNTVGTQITNRLANNRAIFNEASSSDYANASILLNSEYVNRIWAGGIGHWEDGDRRHGIDGYEYDSYGFVLGYDRYFGCNLVAGVAFSYTTGDFEAKSAINDDSDMDNYSFQGYLSYNALNGIFATLMGGYTYTDNDNQWSAYELVGGSNVATRHSEDYSTDSWNIGGKFGYDWTPVGNFVLTPSVGLNYVHASAKAHDRNSSRDGVAWTASRMEKTTVDALLLPVEVAARYDVNFSDCSRLALEANVGYSYNFKKDGGDASIILNGLGQGTNDAPVVLRSIGREQSRHTWNFGAGLRYHYNQFDIGVKYDYYLQSDTDAHRLMGTVGWSF